MTVILDSTQKHIARPFEELSTVALYVIAQVADSIQRLIEKAGIATPTFRGANLVRCVVLRLSRLLHAKQGGAQIRTLRVRVGAAGCTRPQR